VRLGGKTRTPIGPGKKGGEKGSIKLKAGGGQLLEGDVVLQLREGKEGEKKFATFSPAGKDIKKKKNPKPREGGPEGGKKEFN